MWEKLSHKLSKVPVNDCRPIESIGKGLPSIVCGRYVFNKLNRRRQWRIPVLSVWNHLKLSQG